MAQMVMGAFDSREHADMAIDQLEELGYTTKDISVITKDNKVAETKSLGHEMADGAVSGAATGTAIGGVAGLLAGVGIFPALAGLLIGGPIAVALGATGVVAATVSGAVTGAVAGGLIGALVNLGVPEESAKYYDTTINEGGVVVAVPARDGDVSEAKMVLEEHHAMQVTTVTPKEM
jgi:uncharacterized membrane protein